MGPIAARHVLPRLIAAQSWCCRISARGGCGDNLLGELPYRHAVCGGRSERVACETPPPLLSQEAAAFPCRAFLSWNGVCVLAAVGFSVEAGSSTASTPNVHLAFSHAMAPPLSLLAFRLSKAVVLSWLCRHHGM